MTERARVPAAGEKDEEGKPKAAARTATPVMKVLALQRTAGNQAVGRVLARNPQGGSIAETISDWAAEFKRAVAAGEWETAALAAGKLADGEFDALGAQLNESQLAQLEAGAAGPLATQADGLFDWVSRKATFLKNDPGKKAAATTVTVTNEGTLDAEADVGGGKVQVRTGGAFELSSGKVYDEMFSLSYKGPNAATTRWLQFIWREVIADDPIKGTYHVNQSVTTTGGTYNLTTDPSKPSYNTDTGSKTSPFYEEGFVANRTADSTAMFDQPSPVYNIVNAQFDAGATGVTSRAHFVSYLVRDQDVLYEAKIDVEWVFVNKTMPPRTQSVSSAKAADKLDPGCRARLATQFPSFDYLP